MKRVLNVCLVFILVVSVIGVVSAYNTNIHIKTPINKEVQLAVVNNGAVIEKWRNNSDVYGDFKVTFTSSLPKFDLIIYLKQGNDDLMPPERLLDNKAGEDIYIEMVPSGFELVETPNETEIEEEVNTTEVNETETNSTEEVNTSESEEGLDVTLVGVEDINESEGGSFFSGFSIFNDGDEAKYFYYFAIFFACLVFVLLAGFVTAKVVRNKSSGKKKEKDVDKDLDDSHEEEPKKNSGEEHIKVKKLSELQQEMEEKKKAEENKNESEDVSKKIDDLQKKIDDLQKALTENKD